MDNKFFKQGDRVVLLKTMADEDTQYEFLPVGSRGTVQSDTYYSNSVAKTEMKWDNGCPLAILEPPDSVALLMSHEQTYRDIQFLMRYGRFDFDRPFAQLGYYHTIYIELRPDNIYLVDTGQDGIGIIPYDTALGGALLCVFYQHRCAEMLCKGGE